MASGKRCGVCGGNYRTGTLVWTVKDNKLTQVRACPGCTSRAMAIAVPPAASRCECGCPAHYCGNCLQGRVLNARKEAPGIQEAIKRLDGMVRAVRLSIPDVEAQDHHDGKVEGLESAIALLKSVRF